MTRCRVSDVSLVHVPPRGALPFIDAAFDAVLIDAPCSGLGTIRRDPDIRWRREAAGLPAFAEAQRDLLQRARPLVKPGGRIVYSTCSSEPEENELVVAAFLAEAPEFALVPVEDSGLDGAISMVTAEGYLRTNPDHGLEMFFGAILRRR
jgi:16S rRNA (cytosine967-C5)-methyltransferase